MEQECKLICTTMSWKVPTVQSGAESALPTRRSLEEAAKRERQKREDLERAGGVVIWMGQGKLHFLPSFGGLANLVPVGVVVGRFGILGDQAIGAAWPLQYTDRQVNFPPSLALQTPPPPCGSSNLWVLFGNSSVKLQTRFQPVKLHSPGHHAGGMVEFAVV